MSWILAFPTCAASSAGSSPAARETIQRTPTRSADQRDDVLPLLPVNLSPFRGAETPPRPNRQDSPPLQEWQRYRLRPDSMTDRAFPEVQWCLAWLHARELTRDTAEHAANSTLTDPCCASAGSSGYRKSRAPRGAYKSLLLKCASEYSTC